MGAVRKSKPRIPLNFDECKPGLLHYWEERQRNPLPHHAFRVTWVCSNCGKTIIVQTKTIGKAVKPTVTLKGQQSLITPCKKNMPP